MCIRDSDSDGLSDGDELDLGTNPLDPDSDDDGLSDGDEVLVHETDPNDADTDDGGVDDGVEVEAGTDPLDPADDAEAEDDPLGTPKGGGGLSCATAEAPSTSALGALFGLIAALLRRRRG